MLVHSLARVALVTGLLGIALFAGTSATLADGGPHREDVLSGGSTFGGELCATCHRAHQAAGPALGGTEAQREVCYSCHGTSALGSSLDIADGVMAATSQGLKGGGFEFAIMDTSGAGNAVSRPVTSAHGDAGASGVAWGMGDAANGAGTAGFELTCVSCHDPHGNGNYRLLRPIPVGSPVTTEVNVPDEGTAKTYAVSSTSNRYFGQIYMNGNYQAQVTLDQWCAACHNRYDATGQDAAYASSADPIYTYRHGTRMVDPESGNCYGCHKKTVDGVGDAINIAGITQMTAHTPVCENCHVAHGTAAQMGEISQAVPLPDGSMAADGAIRSTLLRLDNRGVCRACHGN